MNHMKRAMIFSAVASAMVLGGCASQEKTMQINVDPGVVKLSQAADEISQSYKVLSYAESARNSQDGAADTTLDYKVSDFPKAWQEEYALEEDYYGELEPFLRGLSRLVGYDEPQVVGRKPVVPATVTVSRSNKPLAEYLIDVSYQAGSRANVVLDTSASRLTITYPQ